MKEISIVERKKEVYIISNEDFVKGEWLEKIKEIFKEGYSCEVSFINNYLTIKKFLFKKNEVTSNGERKK